MPTKSSQTSVIDSETHHKSHSAYNLLMPIALIVIVATLANIAVNWLLAQELKMADRENTSSITRAIEKSNESALIQFGNAENFELYKKVQALKAPEINKQIQAELSKAQ